MGREVEEVRKKEDRRVKEKRRGGRDTEGEGRRKETERERERARKRRRGVESKGIGKVRKKGGGGI